MEFFFFKKKYTLYPAAQVSQKKNPAPQYQLICFE